MVNFSFKVWMEDDIKDKGRVVSAWKHAIPPESDKPQIDSEVWNFVEAIVNPKLNGQLILKGVRGIHFHPEKRYGPTAISGNLIAIQSPLLKEATGWIAPPHMALFGFLTGGPKSGSLIIAPPPFSFTMEDKLILASIIRHELRHAADFVSMGGKGMEATGQIAEVDKDAYYSHIVEARAYSEQLRWLLQMMGNNTELVLNAFKKNPMGQGLGNDFFECAKSFLEELVKQPVKEAVLPYGFDATSPSRFIKTKKEPSADSKNVERAAKLLEAIIDGFRLKNNVKIHGDIKS